MTASRLPINQRLAIWITDHPWLSLLFGLVLFIIGIAGIGGYNYSVDHRAFFSADNPELQAFEQLQDDYSRTDTVIIALTTKSGSVYDPNFLSVVQDLTELSWQIPYTQRVESLTNFQHIQVDGDFIDTDNLVNNPQDLSRSELQKIRSIAQQEPFLVDSLVNVQGSVTGIRLTLNLPGEDPAKEIPSVVMPLRDLAAEVMSAHPDIQVHLVGQTIANQTYPEASQADLTRVWPWFALTMLVMLAWLFRSLKAMAITWSACLLSVIAGVGAIGYFAPTINDAVIVAPVMILTLAIADGIHLVVSWNQSLLAGKDKRQSMLESLSHNIIPMTLTTLLTALGFLTLHFNESPPFQVMGYIVAAGVCFALLFTWLFTAPLLILLPGKPPKKLSAFAGQDSLPMHRLANTVMQYRTPLFWLSLIGGSALAMLSFTNDINDDVIKYYTPETPFRQSVEFVNQELTGVSELNYSLPAGKADAIVDPDYLRRLEEFTDWLKIQPDVVQVNSIVDVIKRVNQVLHNNDPTYYRIPDTREEVAQSLLQYELSLPYGMDLNYLIPYDRSHSRLRVAISSSSGQRLIAIDEAAQQWQYDNWDEHHVATGASLNLMFAHIGERSIAGMFGGMLGSLIIASVLLMVGFRCWQHGVASFVGNLLPIGMAFGVWALLNGNIDLGLTVVLGIAFSVVIDDTVHFLSKYERARRQGLSNKDAVHYAYQRIGFALITTSLVLALGFAWLANSAIQITVNTALVTCLSIGFALLTDLIFMPTLLLKLDKRATPPVTSPVLNKK